MSSDYELRRARTLALVPRSRTLYSRPASSLTREYSLSNATARVLTSYKYKPQWSSASTYRRDDDLYDAYWYDRYYYFSPLFWPRQHAGRRYYYSDHLPNPYYWSSATYWPKYSAYSYKYDFPGHNRRYFDPEFYSVPSYYRTFLYPFYR